MALAAKYTGCAVRWRVVLFGLNTLQASQNLTAFCYSIGKTRIFVSFDFCCRGVKSNYKIVVGRAQKITGPYVDKQGRSMENGGGDLVLADDNVRIGPGGQSTYLENNNNWLVYHYYDARDSGKSKLQINEIKWTNDGWPTLAMSAEH